MSAKSHPTVPQLRVLQFLAGGGELIRSGPLPYQLHLVFDNHDHSFHFHPKVLLNLASSRFLKQDGPDRWIISDRGLAEMAIFCAHHHSVISEHQELAGRLICKKCARALRCVSKKKKPHPATTWHWKWGPACEKCLSNL